jgi:hypothetical protein
VPQGVREATKNRRGGPAFVFELPGGELVRADLEQCSWIKTVIV